MDIIAIKQIEKALGLTLPQYYVDLVTNYPTELLKSDAPDFALLDDPEVVIAENQAVRGKPFYGGSWPDNLLIIGTNGCGDFYVTKLVGEEFSTGFFDHEIPAFLPHSKSRSEFIAKLLQESNDASA
ncbi:MAG: SMI1/KNR4 family protein [Nitrosomonadales bacterium]|nr:SMI1/KNR4 family protein [Nitrosomonadales bacterium]